MNAITSSATALVFQNTTFDIIDRNGQPWLRGPQIGDALGYTKAGRISIHKLYESNSDEFTDSMTAVVKLPTAGGAQETRIFSLRGCHLLAMLSRTKIAKEFRKWVLDILDRETSNAQPALPHHISTEQQGILFTLLCDRFPEGKDRAYAWSRFNNHFRLSSYKNLPAAKFDSACDYIQTIPTKALVAIAQTAEFSDTLRNAINNRAHSLSLEGFDRTREQIAVLVRDWKSRNWSDEQIIKELSQVGDVVGDMRLVSVHTMWSLCTRVKMASIVITDALKSVHEMESKAGRELYGRGVAA